MKKESILGISVSAVNYSTLLDEINKDIQNGKKSLCVAINPEKIMKAQEDQELMKLLNSSAYQIPDGIGIILASKIKGGNISERITGIDLMLHLCDLAVQKNYKLFLYGAKPGVAEEAKQELENQYPGIKIVGTIDGYEEDNEKVIKAINDSRADILFVAKGSPAQEQWMLKYMDQLHVSIYQGVGGSFDVISGRSQRAPVIFQRAGLEWFYRLIKEPKRIKRQLLLPRFLFKVLFKSS